MPSLAIVRQRYNPFGGAERFIARALRPLTDQGLNVTVIARVWPDQQAGEHIIVNPSFVTSLGRDSGFAEAVTRLLQSKHFDLVQSHERIPGVPLYRAGDGVHAMWLDQRAKSDRVLKRAFTQLDPYHRYVLKAERAMFEHANLRAVVCNSAMVKQEIADRFTMDTGKLHVIHNAVDSERFSPKLRERHRDATRKELDIPADAFVFLYVGSGFARKGVRDLLTAMTHVAGLHVVVVGADKNLAKYVTHANRIKVADRVHFTGGVDDVGPYYAAADAFVLPTLYDPCPNAALEAMACGLPAIVSDACGAKEFVTVGVSGDVVAACDSAALADAMQRLMTADHRAMGVAARAAMLPLAPDAMAAKYAALYRTLLA